ncbi:MAG: SH3 domain-containing protein [Caldilineaceae bacterium]
MAERSSASTDVKVLLQSIVTVAIIVAGGYFGMTFLAPRITGMQPESTSQPTLAAYEAPSGEEVASASDIGSTEAVSSDSESADAESPNAAQQASEAQNGRPGTGLSQDNGSIGTPMAPAATPPEGGVPGGRFAGGAPGTDGGPGARLTAIAQGTILPSQRAGGDNTGGNQIDLSARMTAIAEGTLMPGQAPPGVAATPQPTNALAGIENTGEPTGPTVAANTSGQNIPGSQTGGESPSDATEQATASSAEASASGEQAPVFESRLFAVARSSGAKLYDRPDGEVVGDLVAGSAVTALARSDDGLWTLVQGTNSAGWVPVDQLVLFGAQNLPVVSDQESIDSILASSGSGSESAGAAENASSPTTSQQAPGAIGGPVVGEYIQPVMATVTSQNARLNVRDGPGTTFDIVKRANPGEQFVVLARTALGDWVQVALPDTEEGSGWVATDFVALSGQIDSLPVSGPISGSPDAAALSAALPTPTPSAVDSPSSETPRATASVGVAMAAPDTAAGAAETIELRSGPGDDYDVEAVVNAGLDFVELARSEDGEWVRIAILDPPGGMGWVTASQIDRGEDEMTGQAPEASKQETQPVGLAESSLATGAGTAIPFAEPLIAVSASGDSLLNVRSGPGLQFDVVDKLAPGAVRTALSQSPEGKWTQIAVPGADSTSGWVASEFLKLRAAGESSDDAAIGAEAALAAQATVAPLAGTSPAPEEVATPDALSPPEFLPVVGATQTMDTAANLGGTIVFEASNGGQIYGSKLETGELWPITTGFDPAISPDGRTVAFTRDGGDAGLYLVDIDGSNERLIFSGDQRLASPKWSPDGNWIVFSRGNDAYECLQLGPGGCTPIDQLRDRRVPDDVQTTTWVNYFLSVVDVNGENYHDLATLESARAPDWGDSDIVYQSAAGLQRTADEPNASSQLIVFDYLKPYFHDPDWQPGGDIIVYQGKEASHWEIFRINVDGSNRSALTHPKTALVDVIPSNVSPAWNPAGDMIVFLSNRTQNGEAGTWRLWVMDADGGNQYPLPIDVPMSYTFGDEQIVSWGPSID